MSSCHRLFPGAAFVLLTLSCPAADRATPGVLTVNKRPVWTLDPEDAVKHQKMVSQLKAYLADTSPNGRKLTVAYVTPADLEPLPEHRARIDRVMKDIQAYYRDEMTYNGFGPLTFDLELDNKGMVVIHEAKGRKNLGDYIKAQAGQETRNDVLPVLKAAGINPDQGHLMIFCQMPDGISPYYGGGTFRSGTCWACDLPHQDPLRLADPAKLPNGRTVGQDNTVYIGGTAHELGHCFGLPHTAARPWFQKTRGTSLMGAGNYTYREELRGKGKGSYLAESDAIRLASHPLFNRRDKDRDVRAEADLSGMDATWKDGVLTISGKVTATPAPYAVIAYHDPAGGDDYDAPTFTAAPDRDGRFSLNIKGFRNKTHELRLTVCHVNGATTTQKWSHSVDANGTPDLEPLRLRWLLQPVMAALNASPAKVPALLEELAAAHPGDPLLKKWQPVLLGLVKPTPGPAPASVPAETKSVYLSDCQWETAKTGYGPGLANRVYGEGGEVLIFNHGEVFAKGLYAHAPARYVFKLGGTWTRLTGRAGLQDGKAGTVAFLIKSGDKELFHSPTLKDSSKAVSYDLDVTGLDSIELLVDPAGDGVSSDWGVWLEPQLKR